MAYRNFERNLRSLNVFLEKSDDIRSVKDNYAADFDNDFPYDLVFRPYYVDSIMFSLDRSGSTDFDSE
jgi:hypothetical protein